MQVLLCFWHVHQKTALDGKTPETSKEGFTLQ